MRRWGSWSRDAAPEPIAERSSVPSFARTGDGCKAVAMSAPREPRAWLLLAMGEDRRHGGNLGYDDQVAAYYSWDSTVHNARSIREGDAVVVRDKEKLLGVSVVEHIEHGRATKSLLRCPECGKAKFKARTTTDLIYRCQLCKSEFDDPGVLTQTVDTFRSRHDAAWSPLEGLLTAGELRVLTHSPRSFDSMRTLDWAALRGVLLDRGAHRAVARVTGRAPDLGLPSPDSPPVEYAQGHAQAVVRVRRGQTQFRQELLRVQGGICAFTGRAPNRALEAGHLYSYANLGEHHEHGGLLLRRDIHTLFDDGAIAVDPSALRLDVADELFEYPQYRRLHHEPLAVCVRSEQVEWIDKHWLQHRRTT